MDRSAPAERPAVVVVGGGIAALELVLALHDLAPGLVRTTMIAPEPEFTLRPLNVARPFARGHADRLDLAAFMDEHGGRFRRTAVTGVDAERRTVRCSTGPDEPYDVLVVAVGAEARPAFGHSLTFGSDFLAIGGLLADLEEGYSQSVAFVVPDGSTWPLPLYELALMTAQDVWGMDADDVELHLVTPERVPLEIFGEEAGAAVADLLRAAGITLHAGVRADVARNNHVDLGNGQDLHVERIVALPLLDGPRIAGLPSDAQGFLPVDRFGSVAGVDGVWAAGDATTHPVKQGGLACQQADAVATCIASHAGGHVSPLPYVPELRGRLLTGHGDRFLRRGPGESGRSEADDRPLWWPPSKVSGHYLSPYLEARGLVHLPVHADRRVEGVDVQLRLG
ncbi:NAD(P)/FAD-dependent oxidoreductase [Patulibacter sp.]|uniref:NAD(P)/FAD-dependent oxidoreductase n=1 Tax=Patulibacter sp. TaxID=1912859 RepID=UPI002718B2F4|nr:FAD-dependent oxidoreductase [Patulibacter sp.]MDO9410879.1 FAD-dependent oxidoreductase [Patulibacter sp.]